MSDNRNSIKKVPSMQKEWIWSDPLHKGVWSYMKGGTLMLHLDANGYERKKDFPKDID